MREILFRGQRKDTKEWVYGDLFHRNEELLINNFYEGFNIEVVPETIGQYTGLTDKNGTKIWEGIFVETSKRVKLFRLNGTERWLDMFGVSEKKIATFMTSANCSERMTSTRLSAISTTILNCWRWERMAEYVEREALLKMALQEKRFVFRIEDMLNSTEEFVVQTVYKDLFEAVYNIPKADVVEVKHGKWEKKYDEYGIDRGWMCTNCKNSVYQMTYERYEYCPHCGAKLD